MHTENYELPLVAILRGLTPGEAPAIGAALFEAGFRMLEVPLNRPGAIECIDTLVRQAPEGALVGGGTMLTPDHVRAVHGAGGRLMVSPNCDTDVIGLAAGMGMFCAPGVATPTEAFNAVAAGAHALKIFPAEMVGTAGLKAMKAVLPPALPVWPVGGIKPETMAPWLDAGATGFGIGGALFTPGMSAADVGARAQAYADAWRAAVHARSQGGASPK
jgi:2-dehydro-3-deoxyphosphogalactonate aldolase